MDGQRADDRIESGETAFGDLKGRVFHFEARLGDIKHELEGVRGSLEKLNDTVASMRQPDYKTWAAIGGVVVMVVSGITAAAWTLAISPIKEDIGRLYSAAEKASASLESQSKLFEVELKAKLDKTAVDELRADLKATNKEIEELNSLYRQGRRR